MLSTYLPIVILTSGLTMVLCWLMLRARLPSPVSLPSSRSLHAGSIPRGGGLGVAAVSIAAWITSPAPLHWIGLALMLVWIISSLDDWVDMPAYARLIVQAAAIGLCVTSALPPFAQSAATYGQLILLTLALVWATNLYNFMDGADGIAATTAVTAAASFSLLALSSDSSGASSEWMLTITAATIGSCGGFLYFNRPPARIFMGDGGSTVLGLSLACLALVGTLAGLWSIGSALLPLMTFWADASLTLLRRLLRGHNPMLAHRDHYYQRLVLSGLGHSGLLAWILGWNLVAGLAAWLLREASTTLSLAVAFGLVGLYLLACDLAVRWRPHWVSNPRALFALLYDLAAAVLLWIALFWLRFNVPFDGRDFTAQDVLLSLAWMLPIYTGVFIAFGLYRGVWRYASTTDLLRIIYAAFTAMALTVLSFALIRPESFIWPRSVAILHPFLLIVFMGGARMAYRSWKEHTLFGLDAARGDPVIVLGAGDTGARLVKELQRSPQWRVVAMLDDDPTTRGARLHGVPIVGGLDRLQSVSETFGARHAILAMPRAGPSARKRAAELAAAAGMQLLTMPSYADLLSGSAGIGQLRRVELEDLLGREPVQLDQAGLSDWISKQTVLVTGAGGSIGQELCAQIARFQPRRLLLLDVSEFAAHTIRERMTALLGAEAIETYVADVRDRERMRSILDHERPRLVFHAAAYKHVPLTETVNAWEALRNNTLGTIIAAETCQQVGVEKFVLISTDKAVRPANIMGASKRLAELAIMGMPSPKTACVAVRFGNVLGSNGSVIPKFRQQIAAGGPVTVTHPEMTRYFMSIPEATQLVLQAGLLGQHRDLFVLDMGEPMSILELARSLIRLEKGQPEAVPILFTGLRPGEKLHEELLSEGESFVSTAHAKLRRVERATPVALDLEQLKLWLQGPEPAGLRAQLQRWIPEFNPTATR